jgi:exopolyphosphatase/guanosine-5'-triphosphate,3'-diphosphate pyrophosphatase
MNPRAPTDDATLAAIDIGSNSFRLELGQMHGTRYRRVDYRKETVRLGAGLDRDSLLSDEAAERGLACLRRFAERLDGMPPERVRAVATQTLREARNRDAFLEQAQAALGRPIEVISGREEARLIYAGVSQLQPSSEPRLVVDIGGRSTEMILGRGRTPLVAESFAVGSVSLSMRYFGDGRLTEDAFRAAQVAAGAELEEALEPFAARHWRHALGSSGTAGAVSQLLAASGVTDGEITPAALRWCITRCVEAGHIDKLDLPGLRDDRRPVIAGGLSILYTLGTHFGIKALRPAKGALRQGVIVELHERLAAARKGTPTLDMRDASVRALQQRFMVDKLQAKRVRSVALALHTGAMPDAGNETVRELGWAADLHELGMMVSHHDHHRHSAYLLAHVDAAGFSQSQQRRLAELVLGQRGGLRKIADSLANETFAWQVLALRLAAIVCHARGPVNAQALRLSRHASEARLHYDALWGDAHPRAVYLLREEAEAWSRSGVLGLRLPD